ncbi:membrane-associated protein, putative [Bodo saltans]|uniref:Membrane-associated protein, putative n=1 Tax=Bodo saltans TaxID=75058 RepID=A0A0S4IZV1_BODSA|nr:membrane-associated protein, putative [Bodo saltans]|eukprot:CUG27449.1 membrane-associated protein, putative [Bodo saltans]
MLSLALSLSPSIPFIYSRDPQSRQHPHNRNDSSHGRTISTTEQEPITSIVVEASVATSSTLHQQPSDHPREPRKKYSTKKDWRTVTVPLWLGCAALCTILVGVVGFAPFFATQSSNEVIVTSAKEAYLTVVSSLA